MAILHPIRHDVRSVFDTKSSEGSGEEIPPSAEKRAVEVQQEPQNVGFTFPSWEELTRCSMEAPAFDEEPDQPRVGWQAIASRAVESSFLNVVLATLSDPDTALQKSHRGPLASARFVSFSTSHATRLEPQVLEVCCSVVCVSYPLTARVCRCGRLHRSACGVAGVLGRRGFPLETAAARICREACGKVRTNVFVQDLDLGVSTSQTTKNLRCLWMGCLFSKELLKVARRRKARRHPELVGDWGRAISLSSLVLLHVLSRSHCSRGTPQQESMVHADLHA